MKKMIMALLAILLAFTCVEGQKPIAQKTLVLFRGKQPETYNLFNATTARKNEFKTYVDTSYNLVLKEEVLSNLRHKDAGLVRLTLPEPYDVDLDLYRVEVFNNESNIRTSDGREFTPNPQNRYYRGIIHGDPNSVAIVSIFEDRIQILFADENGNKRIQKTQDGNYILFADQDILIPKDIGCFVDESGDFQPEPEQDHSSQRQVTGNCVQVYVECDFKSYQDNGSSVLNTEEWVGELWNEVITLYENEDIPVEVSDVFIYTTPDPYASMTSTSAILYAFRDHIDTLTYDGRLAHLLSTRAIGGGIAYVDVLCSNTYQVAFSASLSTTIVVFPTYSWSVEVVTHEMGHNMGSPHTHACAWNGNNTQIDDCGNQYSANNGGTPEGAACFNPAAPILPVSGSIMSYCHLIGGIGINFNNGFGVQPGDLVRNRYNNASCNTGVCTPPLCTSLTNPVPNATNVDIMQDIFWASATGVTGYKLTIGTTPTNGSILNNVDVGLVTTYNPVASLPYSTIIYVKVVPYNVAGDAVGCTNQSFTTEANVAPLCTQVTQPANGAMNIAVDVIIQWAHSAGSQTGYKISIGTTPNGTDILPLTDVGNVTTYDHPTPFPYASLLYVKITPYWAGGDIMGCASQSFTTVVPINGDLCNTAANLPCGSSINGSTIGALTDTGLPFCVVAIEAPGVWYSFVGDGQNAVIATCSAAGFDTQLNAYQGSCSGLTCVTGIDDFCLDRSLISFPTTIGTTYYILVQGWGGQQGTFTITRECYDGPFYCTSSGRDANTEWIENVTFAGVANPSGSSSYTNNSEVAIPVSRGVGYSVQVLPDFLQTPRNQYVRVWVDFNNDGDFADGGEQVISTGPTQTLVTGTINIPLTAVPGETRMRVSMRYNNYPSTCGTFANGEVEDYKLNIKCNVVTSLTDSGNGSLRNVSACVDDGEPVLFAPALNNQIINVTTGPITVDGQWKWMATPGSNIQIKAVNITRILTIPSGKSAEIQNLKMIGGTATQGSAIDNDGTLIIRDCDIHPATSSNTSPLRNTGMMEVFGICDIRF